MKEARRAYREKDTPPDGRLSKGILPSPDEYLLYIEDYLKKHDPLPVSTDKMMRYVETMSYVDIVELADMIYDRGVNLDFYLNEKCYKALDRYRGLRWSQQQDWQAGIDKCMSTMHQLIPGY